jgi:OFA family oxalate/formate antiporter-like MFS transporter
MTAAAAAIMVGLMGALNGVGRIFWASSSDYIGRPNTYIAFFIIQIPLFLMLPSISHPILFSIALLTILTCYGGGFASIPAYIGDVFGTKELARIHGYILTAWAMAGLIGPMLVSWIGESTGSYALTLYIFSGLFVVALIVSVLMKRYINKFLQQRIAA